MTLSKEDIMKMAAGEVQLLLDIIGDLGYVGYKISMCKLYGNSYQQCANKFGIDKSAAQRHYEKCIEKQYDIALKKIFGLK
jgi:hypothetical protein